MLGLILVKDAYCISMMDDIFRISGTSLHDRRFAGQLHSFCFD